MGERATAQEAAVALRLTQAEFDRILARRSKPNSVKPQPNSVSGSPHEPPGSRWEVEFSAQLTEAGISHEREYRFLPDRKFRFDFALPQAKVAVELDGGVHRIQGRFLSDREKFNLATLAGWRVLRVGADQVRDGSALDLLVKLLAYCKLGL